MAKGKNHITNSDDYQRYLAGQMSARERHDFEKQLLEDDFESEAFDGISELTPDEFSADLRHLRNVLESKSKKRNATIIWRMAATILLLGLFSFIVYYLIDSNTSQEIAQTKEVQKEEKTAIPELPTEKEEDSSQEGQDQIIAYQQKPIENAAKQEHPKIIEKMQADEPEKVEESLIETMDLAMPEGLAEDGEMEIKTDAPAELPAIERDEGLEVPIQIETIERKKEATREAKSPSAVMSQSRRAIQLEHDVRTITGRVVSQEDNEAIPGVNVIMKGSAVGTITNIDGNYSIDIPKDQDVTLVYSYIGVQTEEVKVNEDDSINVILEPDFNNQLSEIVVTAYGSKVDANKQPYVYTPPKPEGGNNAFRDYVKENIRYPSSALKDKIRGTVKLNFTVETDGELSNMEVQKSLGEDFDEEAIRLVNEGPTWEPAIENDSVVVKDVTVKIRFRPPE